MATLAVILTAAVCIGLPFVGRLSSPGAELERTLQTQMDFFLDDMRSLWQNVGTSAVHLSSDMTDILEDCLAENGVQFDAFTGDLDTLTTIEDTMFEPLCQYIRQTQCSGAFVILDAAMRTDSDPDVRSGLYVQKNNAERTGNELLLFFAAPCCLYFAYRFLKPVYEDMNRLQAEAPDKAQMTFGDFEPLSETISTLEGEKQDAQAKAQRLLGEKAKLQSQFDETQSRLESAQRDAKDLADRQKDQIDPDMFRQFKENLNSLNKVERKIYDAYIFGMDFPEIAATFTAKESTLRSQTQSVYKKLGVNSLKLLRRYAAQPEQ